MADAEPARRRPGAPGRDLIAGPIGRTLLLFALPTLGSNILQSLNGSINAVWVGRFLGEAALAATSNANIVMFLLFSLGFGFALATTILVGQQVGRRDLDAARRALGTGFGLFLIVGVAIAVLGWVTAPALLRALATPPTVAPLALAYLRVIYLGMPSIFLIVLLTMGMRGFGDAVTPFWFMILTVVLDAGLNPVFILGLGPVPRMGIAGAATATLIANSAVLVGLIAYAYARDLPVRLRGRELRYIIPDPALLRIIAAKGLPMGLQMLMMSLSGLVLVGLVNRLGVDTAAAYGVVQQLWGYIQMPALAVGAAVSAMAAQNIGAGRWDRVSRIAGAGVAINVAMTGAIVAVLLLLDTHAIALFLGAGSPAIPAARHMQLIGSWSFILFGVTMVLFAVARANGAVWGPLVILTAGVLLFRIAFAWTLLPAWGADALWWSFPAGSLVTLVLGVAYYRHGGWRRQSLIAPPGDEEVRERACADAEPGGRLNPTG